MWLGGQQPSAEDREALESLAGNVPDPVSHPHLFAWYAIASKFSDKIKKTWQKSGGSAPAAKDDKKKGGKGDGKKAKSAAAK